MKEVRGTDILAVRKQLKEWERAFQQEHGHAPTSADVKEDASIGKLYRKYAELKKANNKENVPSTAPSICHLSRLQTSTEDACCRDPLSQPVVQHISLTDKQPCRKSSSPSQPRPAYSQIPKAADSNVARDVRKGTDNDNNHPAKPLGPVTQASKQTELFVNSAPEANSFRELAAGADGCALAVQKPEPNNPFNILRQPARPLCTGLGSNPLGLALAGSFASAAKSSFTSLAAGRLSAPTTLQPPTQIEPTGSRQVPQAPLPIPKSANIAKEGTPCGVADGHDGDGSSSGKGGTASEEFRKPPQHTRVRQAGDLIDQRCMAPLKDSKAQRRVEPVPPPPAPPRRRAPKKFVKERSMKRPKLDQGEPKSPQPLRRSSRVRKLENYEGQGGSGDEDVPDSPQTCHKERLIASSEESDSADFSDNEADLAQELVRKKRKAPQQSHNIKEKRPQLLADMNEETLTGRLQKLKAAALKQRLEARGLSKSGSKQELVQRLSEAMESEGGLNSEIQKEISEANSSKPKQAVKHTWAQPAALRRVASGGGVSSKAKGYGLSGSFTKTASCGRDNFVKLNINGKGFKRRKFINKTNFRKFKRKWYKRVEHAEKGGGVGGANAPSLRQNEGWLESEGGDDVNLEHVSDPPCTAGELASAIEAAQADPSEANLQAVLKVGFGFSGFREGQVAAIQRILLGQSTFLILPTGAGKSLCYQLPALLLPSLTLVISPLVALMKDQLDHLPACLSGALLSSAQTRAESSSVIDRLRSGNIKVLFISPERLFSETFLSVLAGLPTVALAVVDEAHCVSEWSHNFRPSYHRLGSVVRARVRPQCLLAMTATATPETQTAVAQALGLPPDALINTLTLRNNLHISVSQPKEKLRALLVLLRSPALKAAKSVIVYCTFQADAEEAARYLEVNGIRAKSYHGGKTAPERTRIQQLFCTNKLRVVVATVAFGMGLDKSDVQAVIHYNMPRSMEQYVQEIGRAGRDNRSASCHLFLDDTDYLKLRSLSYSDGADEASIDKLLAKVFEAPTEESRTNYKALVVTGTAQELDLKEEVIATILSCLEAGAQKYLQMHSSLLATCAMTFHKEAGERLADRNPLVAAALKRGVMKQGQCVFDIPMIASDLKVSLLEVQAELHRLQAGGDIQYELRDSAFCFNILQTPKDICALSREIAAKLSQVEFCKVAKLDFMYHAATSALEASRKVLSGEGFPSEESPEVRSAQTQAMHSAMEKYFTKAQNIIAQPKALKPVGPFLRPDVKAFLRSFGNHPITGRAIARILHGLWSPAFPYDAWSKNHFWGRHADVDFNELRQVATQELLFARTSWSR